MNIVISDSPNSKNSEKNTAQNVKLLDQTPKILFFTAKLDERARIIVPAAIRKKLGISFSATVFVGIEKIDGSGRAINVPEKEEGGEDNE